MAQDLTTVVHRLLAGHAVVGLVPRPLQLLMQGPGLDPGWPRGACAAPGVVIVGLVVQSVRRRPVRWWTGAFAVLTPVAVVTFPAAAPPVLVGPQPFLWWQVALAVVRTGAGLDARRSVGDDLVLTLAWTLVRTTPAGGATGLAVAGAEGVFGVLAGLVVAVVARGRAELVVVVLALRATSSRQVVLRGLEDDALDASVRQRVAVVQRLPWVTGLRAGSHLDLDLDLDRRSLVSGPVPAGLRGESLLLAATLRESLVARDAVDDELGTPTAAARRRGIDVRRVDSRRTVVPAPLGQALLDAVRRALAVEPVVRLVVRLAPEGRSTSASVRSEEAPGTHVVRIDADGVTLPAEVVTRGP